MYENLSWRVNKIKSNPETYARSRTVLIHVRTINDRSCHDYVSDNIDNYRLKTSVV